MKRVILAGAFALVFSSTVFAWNCPSGQERVQAPPGTPTSAPFYDVVEGIAFICQPTTPSDPSNSNTNSNTNQNVNQNSSNSSSKSDSNSTSSSAYSGSISKATGGSVKNAGNSQSYSGLENSGNSASTATAKGGAVKDSGNSTSTSSASADGAGTNNGNGNGNTSDSNNTTYKQVHQTATALAPTQFPTASCFKTFGAAGQGGVFGASFGGGRIDPNCAALETAKAFAANGSRLGYCKVMITTKSSKAAGVTLEDCLQEEKVAVVAEPTVAAPVPIVVPPASVTINVPAPIIQAAPTAVKESMTPEQEIIAAKAVKRHGKPCLVVPAQK